MPSGGVTVKAIYDELTAAGASTVQALGIMANMINESGFNPEAVGDQGTSFGLVQQHGSYGYLVTGNPLADMKRQIATLKGLGGFRAASGNTPGEAAGNFAANYERCVGCQPGGAQWQGRVGNASKVVGWFRSGKWPQSAGTPSGGGGGGGGTQQAQLTAFTGNPLDIATFPFQILDNTLHDIWGTVSGTWKAGESLGQISKVFTALVGLFNALLGAIEWIFVPSHWVRIIAFWGGVLFIIPALYSLMKTGQGSYGDITLALGILLTIISGVLFFIAFHNLPDSITNLSELLGWITKGIRTGHADIPPYPPSKAFGGGDLGPGVPSPPGGDFGTGAGANSFS